MLQRNGHEAWTADQAGLAQDVDDEITVYAMDHNAVVITHDRQFTERRKKSTIGHHVRLNCPEWDAAELLETVLGEVTSLISSGQNRTIEVSPGRHGQHEVKFWVQW